MRNYFLSTIQFIFDKYRELSLQFAFKDNLDIEITTLMRKITSR